MKVSRLIFAALVAVPVVSLYVPAVNEVAVLANSSIECTKVQDPVEAYGIKHKLKKKFGKAKKQAGKVQALKKILADIKEIAKTSSEQLLIKRDIVDDLLYRVFVALKNSGFVNSIVKFSLTDDATRHGVVELTADLLEREVIPWEEILEALKTSGLAVDVIKHAVTDPDTRQGVIDLIIELIPQLIESGVLDLSKICKPIHPIGQIPPGKIPMKPPMRFLRPTNTTKTE